MITPAEAILIQQRLARNRKDNLQPDPQQPSRGYKQESELREKILEFCGKQWPRWKCVWARDDRKSTLPVGTHDITVLASGGKIFCMELKSHQGKPTPEQRDWIYECHLLGHEVYIVRDMAQFLTIVDPATVPNKSL